MGVDLYLRTSPTSDDFPGWSQRSNAGAKEIAFVQLPRVLSDDIEDLMFRPTNFLAWRSYVESMHSNRDQWLAMLDILEANPEVWIYVSA